MSRFHNWIILSSMIVGVLWPLKLTASENDVWLIHQLVSSQLKSQELVEKTGCRLSTKVFRDAGLNTLILQFDVQEKENKPAKIMQLRMNKASITVKEKSINIKQTLWVNSGGGHKIEAKLTLDDAGRVVAVRVDKFRRIKRGNGWLESRMEKWHPYETIRCEERVGAEVREHSEPTGSKTH